tara:strand:+ start:317 stop:484 length:168 start_codon:yes stop_codon:yes gene_type:complete
MNKSDKVIISEYQENEINKICENCKKEDQSVVNNFILTGFKYCESCRISKTIFPI